MPGEKVSAVMLCKQFLAYALHIDWCYHCIHKHSIFNKHSMMTSGMHRRPFQGRHLVYFFYLFLFFQKFRENLTDLQRGVDDVNDQAARFSAHNVPLAAEMSTRLHRLNARWKNLEGSVNERWRQVAGRSRDITPLTPAQLASSVSQPWERAVANNKVPYYIKWALI